MTDTSTPSAAPIAPPAAPAQSKLPLIAIILAGVGFLLAVIPATSGIAWAPLVAGIVLGIVALARKAGRKALSIVAIVLGAVGWLVSIIVFLVSAALGLGDAIQSANDGPSVSQSDGSTSDDATEGEADAPADEAGIGDTVTSGDGVSFTVNAVTCGIPAVGEGVLAETAKGEFCEVQLTLANGTDEALNVSNYDFTAYLGKAEYKTSSSANRFGGEYFGTDVNPGLSTDAVVYFDVPASSTLDTVQYLGLLSFDDALVVKVS